MAEENYDEDGFEVDESTKCGVTDAEKDHYGDMDKGPHQVDGTGDRRWGLDEREDVTPPGIEDVEMTHIPSMNMKGVNNNKKTLKKSKTTTPIHPEISNSNNTANNTANSREKLVRSQSIPGVKKNRDKEDSTEEEFHQVIMDIRQKLYKVKEKKKEISGNKRIVLKGTKDFKSGVRDELYHPNMDYALAEVSFSPYLLAHLPKYKPNTKACTLMNQMRFLGKKKCDELVMNKKVELPCDLEEAKKIVTTDVMWYNPDFGPRTKIKGARKSDSASRPSTSIETCNKRGREDSLSTLGFNSSLNGFEADGEGGVGSITFDYSHLKGSLGSISIPRDLLTAKGRKGKGSKGYMRAISPEYQAANNRGGPDRYHKNVADKEKERRQREFGEFAQLIASSDSFGGLTSPINGCMFPPIEEKKSLLRTHSYNSAGWSRDSLNNSMHSK